MGSGGDEHTKLWTWIGAAIIAVALIVIIVSAIVNH